MNAPARRRSVLDAVCEPGKKRGKRTCTDIAKRLGLSPSTYLMNILYSLWDEHKIEGEEFKNSKGNRVIIWYEYEENDYNEL